MIGQALDALCDFRSQFEGLRLTKGTEICLRNEYVAALHPSIHPFIGGRH